MADNRLSELAALDDGDLKKVIERLREAYPSFDVELTAPAEWLDFRFVAPRLLKFMARNKDLINDQTPARLVMAAWYYEEHPSSSESQKMTVRALLANPGER